jgi:hypothetical protein
MFSSNYNPVNSGSRSSGMFQNPANFFTTMSNHSKIIAGPWSKANNRLLSSLGLVYVTMMGKSSESFVNMKCISKCQRSLAHPLAQSLAPPLAWSLAPRVSSPLTLMSLTSPFDKVLATSYKRSIALPNFNHWPWPLICVLLRVQFLWAREVRLSLTLHCTSGMHVFSAAKLCVVVQSRQGD